MGGFQRIDGVGDGRVSEVGFEGKMSSVAKFGNCVEIKKYLNNGVSLCVYDSGGLFADLVEVKNGKNADANVKVYRVGKIVEVGKIFLSTF